MKYTRYRDIPQFTDSGSYQVNVSWDYIEKTLENFAGDDGIDLDPDFQRAHVWDETRQVRYVEYVLRGGRSSRDIYFNAPGWNRRRPANPGPVVLVDGKQRLEAVRRFWTNELKVFGSYRREFTDTPRIIACDFVFRVNDLTSRAQVLQWYCDLNDGGVAHTAEEIEKVKKLLEIELHREGRQ